MVEEARPADGDAFWTIVISLKDEQSYSEDKLDIYIAVDILSIIDDAEVAEPPEQAGSAGTE